MIETKELVKIYKPKKGVPVVALDKVSLKFPEKGMVFLLGKSGSGKSTLLNVLGGLDVYNDGEVIIKGVSSKDFKQKHFDSYRNTYVGFIFQEYNVLDEFSVGANIALAIELQNRKATDDEVNRILKEVDLEGFGNRKPNELSGGQKQRVAIARALVKNPQIIMADEPTGALDSNTGKAIFDTLKKLSSEKLVIVVSHDREFAELYADRIIELSDGRVISDVEYDPISTESAAEPITYNGNTVSVLGGYHITEEDRLSINRYIDELKGENLDINISAKKTVFKRFVNTDISKIKTQDSSTFKLIKSKLPLKNAFKIGASSLKYKKIRLVITILLSCISFGLFGLADTFGAYNHIKTCTNSLVDTDVQYVATAKSKHIGEGMNAYWRDYGYFLSDKDLEEIKKNTAVEMHGVYAPIRSDLSFEQNTDTSLKLTESDFDIYSTRFSGFAEISDSVIKDMGFKLLAGNLPNGEKNEIAISEYIFEVFKKGKYTDMTIDSKSGKYVYQDITDYKDIIGKTVTLNDTKFTVTAVIDTNFNLERYKELTAEKEYQSEADRLVDYVLFSEFGFASSYSYSGLIMTGEGYVEKLIQARPNIARITEGYISFHGDSFGADSEYLAKLSDTEDQKIIWVNGKKTNLGEKEIIVTSDALYDYTDSMYEYADENGKVDYAAYIKEQGNTLSAWEYIFDNSIDENTDGWTIVGVIDNLNEDSGIYSTIVCSDKKFEQYTDGSDSYYEFCVGAMPKGKENINNLVKYCYREDSDVRFQIQNSVTYELDMVNETLQEFSVLFLYIGLGFAAFAALMLANFIGTSISYKKQEIGILRAIGSRSNDVFRIFFAESFIIAMINFVLSALGVFAVTTFINYIIRHEIGILITVLTFDFRQIILLFAVSLAVAFIASFLPVKKIASKKPIDAIRDR